MTAVINSGDVIVPIGARVLGRTNADDITDPANGKVIVPMNTLIDEGTVEVIEKAQVQAIRIRSVLTCESKIGVCGKCYGRDLARGTPVNLGEAVGVIAAQSIGEPGTQLTMRTFHIGGTAQVAEQSSVESSFAGTIRINNRAVARDSQGRLMSMTRNMTVTIVDDEGVERATHKMLYGAHLRVDEGDKIKRGARLAEWDPYTRPLLTEADGTVEFEDLVEGISMNEQMDEATGIANRIIIDWRATPRGADLKPAMVIKDAKGNAVKLSRGGEARYTMSVEAILSVEPGTKVKAGDVLGPRSHGVRQDARHHGRSAARGGAVRGTPSQGSRHHRRSLGPGRVRQGLQGQAPPEHHPGWRRCRGRRVPDPARQAHRRAGRRPHRARRLPARWASRTPRHPGDQGRRGAWRNTSSTRSRTSTGCKA